MLSAPASKLLIRRIVVQNPSANAIWSINITDGLGYGQGYTVLDSSWGIADVTFDPPAIGKGVGLFLRSSDGTNASVTILIIYDFIHGI